MKKLNLLFLIVCLIFSASQGLAQNKKKDKEQQQQMANALITKDTIKFHPEEVVIGGVYKAGFRGIKSILDPQTRACVGHYAYFKTEKDLKFMLFDTELKALKTFDVPSSEKSGVGSASYNGAYLAFTVYDEAGKMRIFALNINGDPISDKSINYSAEFNTSDLVPCVDDKGFYLVSQVKEDKQTGYTIYKYDSAFQEQWKKDIMPESNGYIIVEAAISDKGKLILVQRTAKNVKFSSSEALEPSLVCYDQNNGDLLFKSPLYDKNFLSVPNQLIIDKENNIVVAGEYYEGQKMKESNSDGVFIKKLSPAGDELVYNKVSWKEGVQKQLAKTQLSISGKNKVYIHKIALTEDGGYQLIAETFSVSAARKLLSSAASLLSLVNDNSKYIADGVNNATYLEALISGRYIGEPTNNEAPITINAQDFLILNFASDGQIEEVSKVEKEYTKVFIYNPYMYLGGLKLAKLINEYGYMDYAFTVKAKDSDNEVLISNCANAKDEYIGTIWIKKGEEKKQHQLLVERIGYIPAADGKKEKKRKVESVGLTPGADGMMVIYFMCKEDKSKSGELHMFKETIKM